MNGRQDLRKHHLPRFLPFIHGQVVTSQPVQKDSWLGFFHLPYLFALLFVSRVFNLIEFRTFIIIIPLINMHVRVFVVSNCTNHICLAMEI